MRRTSRIAVGILGLVGFVGLIQLVPYGRTHRNPPVLGEPAWDSPRTRELAVRACFNCHSNETRWPAYSDIAPISWVVYKDVEDARETVNFSEWTRPRSTLVQESGPSVIRKDMPPYKYRMAHPEAQLTDAETTELARGLNATLGAHNDI